MQPGKKPAETRLIAVTEQGYRVGEDHHRAKLSNADVETIWMHLEARTMTHRQLAALFGVARSTIGDIACWRRRIATPMGTRRITVVSKGRDVATGKPVAISPRSPANDGAAEDPPGSDL